MPNNKDEKASQKTNLNAVDAQVTAYFQSDTSAIRIATTNAALNINGQTGGVQLTVRASNQMTGVITAGFYTVNSHINVISNTLNITKYHSSVRNTYYGTSYVKNTHYGSKTYIEKSPYFDCKYYDLVDEKGFGQFYNQDLENDYFSQSQMGAADGLPKLGTWYEFPSLDDLVRLIGRELTNSINCSKEYSEALKDVDSLKTGQQEMPVRKLMNSSIPTIDGNIPIRHISHLQDQPKTVEDAKKVGATIKFIFPRGARQTFQFFSAWLRNFYFGGSTSYYFGAKNEVYLTKHCTTTNEQYALVAGKSLQHYSHKDGPAIIQYEGGLELNHIAAPVAINQIGLGQAANNDARYELKQQIAIKTKPSDGMGIYISSSYIELKVNTQQKVNNPTSNSQSGSRASTEALTNQQSSLQGGDNNTDLKGDFISLKEGFMHLQSTGGIKIDTTQYYTNADDIQQISNNTTFKSGTVKQIVGSFESKCGSLSFDCGKIYSKTKKNITIGDCFYS